MPECENCGDWVSKRYARVFTPDGIDRPRVCPRCEHKTRDASGKPAETKQRRNTARGVRNG